MRGFIAILGAAVAFAALVSTAVSASPGGARVLEKRATVYSDFGCVGPVVRPRRIVLTCADAGLIVQTIHWTSWGHRIAKGRGTVRYNDCDPFCAGGHYHYVRGARLRMSRIRYCANTGHDQYHRLVIHSRAFKNRRHRYAMTVGCHTFGALRVGTRAAAACPPPQDVHTAYRVHPARGVLDGQAIDPEVEPAK